MSARARSFGIWGIFEVPNQAVGRFDGAFGRVFQRCALGFSDVAAVTRIEQVVEQLDLRGATDSNEPGEVAMVPPSESLGNVPSRALKK